MPAQGRVAFGAAAGAVCLLLSLACVPNSPAQNLPPSSSPAVSEKLAAYNAPLELIRDKPYVSVMVNGHGPFRFLIDTGTGAEALISPEIADGLALPVVGHARLKDPSGKGEQRSEILLIRSLKVAGVEFAEIRAVRHRLYGEEENCQGVLGFTLFKDYLFTLDYPGRRIVLAPGAIAQDGGGSVLPFRMPDGVPIIALRVGGQHVEAQIDSGGTGLSLPRQLARELKFLSTPVEFGSGESLATRFQIKAARLRPDVRLGRYAFRQAFVEINPAFPLMNVGSTPLAKFVVTFDQAKMLLRLYSNQKTLHLDASPAQLELNNAPNRRASDRKLVPVG
ncbi:MAG TPA: aspartyl protease family protein [Terracidiphilus sp.]|nr:aspartyl protease family protein [Terracidiphilus sp.]